MPVSAAVIAISAVFLVAELAPTMITSGSCAVSSARARKSHRFLGSPASANPAELILARILDRDDVLPGELDSAKARKA